MKTVGYLPSFPPGRRMQGAQRAQKENKTLDSLFNEWLQQYTENAAKHSCLSLFFRDCPGFLPIRLGVPTQATGAQNTSGFPTDNFSLVDSRPPASGQNRVYCWLPYP